MEENQQAQNPQNEEQTSQNTQTHDPYGVGGDAPSHDKPQFTQSELNRYVQDAVYQFKNELKKQDGPDHSNQYLDSYQDHTTTEKPQYSYEDMRRIAEEAYEKKQQEHQQKQWQQQQQEDYQRMEQSVVKAQKQYDDFDYYVSHNADIVNDPIIPDVAAQAEEPAQFLYALAKKYPEELKNIKQMNKPMQKIRKLNELEYQLKNQSKKQQSEAPQPVNPDVETQASEQTRPMTANDMMEELAQKAPTGKHR